jgi:Cu2+-exporting ATPase
MKHTYKITGMTCGGCKSHVQRILESVKEIEAVTINLEDGATEIEMTKEIPLDKLKQLFDGTNYQIN